MTPPVVSYNRRVVWPGGHNAVRAVVTRLSCSRWLVEMSGASRGVCTSGGSVKEAWIRALTRMLQR